MSKERWDIAIKVLNGPLASLGEQVFRGPVVRIGADPGPGGVKLNGYRGLDARQCVITAYDGGSASVAPVGSNQLRLAPHAQVKWKEIDPIYGPEYLSEGCAIHLGPVGRGCTIEFVQCRRLGVWEQGRLASEARGSGAVQARPAGPPAAIDVKQVQASTVPLWFLGILFLMAIGTATIVLAIVTFLLLNNSVAELGPTEDGYEFYESVDVDNVEISTELLDGLEQPFYDFIMEPNMRAAPGRRGLDKPGKWDQRFFRATTASVQKHVRAWAFFRRLEQVKNEYAGVVTQMRAADLPEVFSAIPYQESLYKADMTSSVCAKGYWQFMPEVARRVNVKGGIDIRVQDCRFQGRPGYTWTPKDLSPPSPVRNADYIDQGACQITDCAVDDRMDLRKSTKAAVYALGEAFKDPILAQSGAVTQLTILSHNAGYDDSRFGPAKRFNVLPAYRRFEKENGKENGSAFYGSQIRCSDHTSKKWCGASIPPEAQHYVYNIVAQHFIATCYYGENYGNETAFKPYEEYTRGNGYCRAFKIPSKDDVRRRRKK